MVFSRAESISTFFSLIDDLQAQPWVSANSAEGQKKATRTGGTSPAAQGVWQKLAERRQGPKGITKVFCVDRGGSLSRTGSKPLCPIPAREAGPASF